MLLELKDCCFSYGEEPMIRDLSMRLDYGEILAIMGSNGIGKTTLLKCICRLNGWQKGSCLLNGEKTYETKRNISYVPQGKTPTFSYKVIDLVSFGRYSQGGFFASPKKEDYNMAMALLEAFKIADLAEKKCNQISGGELQLVYIAKALISQPKILILDEPENNLDFYNQLKIYELLKGYVSNKKTGIIINTHSLNTAQWLSDKILFMGKGTYVFGPTESILTESNVENFFSVQIKKVPYSTGNIEASTFAFIKTCT